MMKLKKWALNIHNIYSSDVFEQLVVLVAYSFGLEHIQLNQIWAAWQHS